MASDIKDTLPSLPTSEPSVERHQPLGARPGQAGSESARPPFDVVDYAARRALDTQMPVMQSEQPCDEKHVASDKGGSAPALRRAWQTASPECSRTPKAGLFAIVDMGSNGIRFSIADTAPKSARTMPVVFQERAAISIYDAQYPAGSDTRQPIPQSIMDDVLDVLYRWRTICDEHRVPEENVVILATEATRTAPNAVPFLAYIHQVVGLKVRCLSPVEEGQYGVWGVASSVDQPVGMVMDLGGGSLQINWIVSSPDGQIRMSDSPSVSLPYGAARLKRELSMLPDGPAAAHAFRQTTTTRLSAVLSTLDLPPEIQSQYAPNQPGITLYLSGGGFRAWGNLLMSAHAIDPYPVPIINGFRVPGAVFLATAPVLAASAAASPIFRISARRTTQIDAIAFLVSCLSAVLPPVQHAVFSQGGIREGLLFSRLPPLSRATSPLLAASPTAPPSHLSTMLVPALALPSFPPSPILPSHLLAATALAPHFAPLPKELRAPAALRTALTGPLAATHGLSHPDRAVLGLLLAAAQGNALPPADRALAQRFEALLGAQTSWWCRFLGLMLGLGTWVYPAPCAVVGPSVEVKMREETAERRVVVEVCVLEGSNVGGEGLRERARGVEKVGKKKNWVVLDNGEAWGLKVGVEVR